MPVDLRDFQAPSGRSLQYFIDTEAPAGSDLLIYHHGTPAAGPIQDELLGAARAAGLMIVELVRPGYGRTTRQPGRKVADVGPLVAELADHLGYDRFVTMGWSGGGPHAIATAALLPDRCAGALTLAGAGPFDQPGLDFLAGMGQDNLDEFAAALAGPDELTTFLESLAPDLRQADPATIVADLQSLLPPVEVAVLTGNTGQQMADIFAWALATGIAGWFDDDVAFIANWGFDFAQVRVPVAVWQGDQDLMVPVAHGRWLCEHLPTAVPHLVAGEGHLSLAAGLEPGLRELRGWLAG